MSTLLIWCRMFFYIEFLHDPCFQFHSFNLIHAFNFSHWKNTQNWQREISTWKDVIARYKDDITFSRRHLLFKLFSCKRHADICFEIISVSICKIKRVCRMLYLGSGWIKTEFWTDKTVPLLKNVEWNWIESS